MKLSTVVLFAAIAAPLAIADLFGDCKGVCATRRRLEKALSHEEVNELFENCGSADYETFGYVENNATHFDIVARPVNPNEYCKDAIVFDDYGSGERMIMKADDTDFGAVWEESAFDFGSFPLHGILNAADAAGVVHEGEYDLLTNNCASFVINVMGRLGIPATHDFKKYAVQAMLGSPELIKNIRNHPNAGDMLPQEGETLEGLSDKQVLWRLASIYVADHYGKEE